MRLLIVLSCAVSCLLTVGCAPKVEAVRPYESISSQQLALDRYPLPISERDDVVAIAPLGIVVKRDGSCDAAFLVDGANRNELWTGRGLIHDMIDDHTLVSIHANDPEIVYEPVSEWNPGFRETPSGVMHVSMRALVSECLGSVNGRFRRVVLLPCVKGKPIPELGQTGTITLNAGSLDLNGKEIVGSPHTSDLLWGRIDMFPNTNERLQSRALETAQTAPVERLSP